MFSCVVYKSNTSCGGFTLDSVSDPTKTLENKQTNKEKMKLIWSPETASKAYIDTVKSVSSFPLFINSKTFETFSKRFHTFSRSKASFDRFHISQKPNYLDLKVFSYPLILHVLAFL